jgi:phosphoglycolate phosphatase
MKCNLCGGTVFKDVKHRINAKCVQCGSNERTRLLWMYIEKAGIDKNTKVLHLAPEEGIYNALVKKTKKGNYVTSDLQPFRYPYAKNCVKIDLCELDNQPSNEYDIIIHSHVLEHIPCNIAYTLFHLHRMLKKDGQQICIIPFMKGKYDECFQEIGDEERNRRFGLCDHVRRFGNEDIQSHLGKLVNIPNTFDATDTFSEEVLIDANIPKSRWTGFHGSTVLKLAKYDMKFIFN